MTIVLPLILISLAAGGLALATFLWTVASGQYDDLDGAAARMLMEEETTDEEHAEQSP